MSGPTRLRDLGLLRRLGIWLWDLLLAFEPLWKPLAVLVGLILLGAGGFAVHLDVGFLDGLYQAIITISTVGFEEIRPFSTTTQLFASFLIVTGVGTGFYALTLLGATVIDGEFRRNYLHRLMRRRIEHMHEHHVLCGFGRVGREVARGLYDNDMPFVVVDASEEACGDARAAGYDAVHGDATDEVVLREAGLERARSVLASTDRDAVNTYITLTSRKVQPGIHVVARSQTTGNEDKLRMAGADRIISPHALSGRRMMLAARQPLVTEFFDVLASGSHESYILAEIDLDASTPQVGMRLRDAFEQTQATLVLGIRRPDGRFEVRPSPEHELSAGETVILLTREEQITNLSARVR